MIRYMLKDWMFNKLIPWFIKHIWPEVNRAIKVYVIENGAKLLKLILELIKDVYSKWTENTKLKQEHAKQKYEEACLQISEAKSPADVDKYKAIAEVWREVFEQYRYQNDQLKEELAHAKNMVEDLSRKMENDVEKDMDHLDVDGIMKSKASSLPALPMPSGKSENEIK